MKQATFSKRMTARKEWSVSELEAIAAFFDVPITDLFGTVDLRKRESRWIRPNAESGPSDLRERGTRCISDSPDQRAQAEALAS
jgi:hypothetical protein